MNIKKLINELPISNDCKIKVGNLVQAIIPNSTLELPNLGEVWLVTSERVVMITDTHCVQIDDIFPFKGSNIDGRNDIRIGFQTNNANDNKFHDYWYKKLANSPAEYFKNKKKILESIEQ